MPLVRCGSSAKRACNHIGTDNRLPALAMRGSSPAQARERPPPCEPPITDTRCASTCGISIIMRANCTVSRKICRISRFSGSSESPRTICPCMVVPNTPPVSCDEPAPGPGNQVPPPQSPLLNIPAFRSTARHCLYSRETAAARGFSPRCAAASEALREFLHRAHP